MNSKAQTVNFHLFTWPVRWRAIKRWYCKCYFLLSFSWCIP